MTVRAILSDQHFHNWSQFSKTNEAGENTRLRIVLDEMKRAAKVLKSVGGNEMIFAGDLFHVRGSIDPEVWNPVHETIGEILDDGIFITAIPGNHDLKGRETTELGNAIQTLGSQAGFTVISQPEYVGDVMYVPWCSTPDILRAKIDKVTLNRAEYDLVIHTPINGVIEGLPDHGLTSAEVAAWGFKRVFAGHYHNHKIMEGGKVISIGATAHQTWSDVGSKAGFLIVDDATVTWHASHAPRFVEINADTDEEEIPLIVDQNYVRIRDLDLSNAEVASMRDELLTMGAKGTLFQTAPKTVSARASAPGTALSLEQSLAKYITKMAIGDADIEAKVIAACNDIVSAATAAAA